MNLTLHIVRTDLVRMRAWIACWIGVVLLPIGIGVTLLAKNPFVDDDWNLPNTLAILAGLQVLVGYILTIVLIHEHGIVGTRQFWLTRPISRGRLLCAKMLAIVIIVGALPVVVSLPWWLWCGFGGGQVARAAIETLGIMMLAAVPAALMAVLTDSFPRALLWTVVLAGVGLFTMLFFTIVNAAVAQSSLETSLVVSRSVVAVIAVAVVMAAVVVVQVLVRRRGWWLGAAGALVVASIVASTKWPWPWVSEVPRERNASRAAGVNMRFDRAFADPPPRRSERQPSQEVFQRVETRAVMSGIPAGVAMHPAGSWHRWSWPDGRTTERKGDYDDAVENHFPSPDPETRRWLEEHDADLKVRAQRPADEVAVRSSAWFQPSMVARMQSEPPAYEAKLWWQFVRFEPRFELPLTPGKWVRRGGFGVRIETVRRHVDQMTVTTVATRPALISTLLRENAIGQYPSHWFRVYNQGLIAAIKDGQGRDVGWFNAFDDLVDKPRRAIVNGVEIWWRVRLTAAPTVIREGKWVVAPGWQDGGSLVLMAMHEDAMFSREVKVGRFELAPAK